MTHILDARVIYPEQTPCFRNTHYITQCLISHSDYCLDRIPIIGHSFAHPGRYNVVVDNTDGVDERRPILKVTEVYPSQSRNSVFITRYYHLDRIGRMGSLFRVHYSYASGMSKNYRILRDAPDRSVMSSVGFSVLSKLHGRVDGMLFARAYANVMHFMRAAEARFSHQSLMRSLTGAVEDQVETYIALTALGGWDGSMSDLPDYQCIPLADITTHRHMNAHAVPIEDILGGYERSSIDLSVPDTLWEPEIPSCNINNLDVFGETLNFIQSYRLTDFKNRIRFPAGATKGIQPYVQDYLVDRLSAYEISTNIWVMDGGIAFSHIEMIFAAYLGHCHVPVFSEDVVLTITKTFNEELTYRFTHLTTREESLFYFNLNSCTLLSPETCVNRFHQDYGRGPRLTHEVPEDEVSREVSLWL